jgi:hypothetical protein
MSDFASMNAGLALDRGYIGNTAQTLGQISSEAEATRDVPAITMRMIDACAHVRKLAAAVRDMADKHYGPVPEACSDQACGASPNGNVHAAFEAADSLDEAIRALGVEVHRLARL